MNEGRPGAGHAQYGLWACDGAAAAADVEHDPALRDYAPLAAAKGDFPLRAGRAAEARDAFERAAALSRNQREKAFLLARAVSCQD